MDKRYQVFISSTFTDLREERQAVITALLQLDAIPSGMELFPAADDDAWTLITKVIDDCDYYLLIIGGRYGSTDPDGVSYTEREFDYAVSRGKPVMAFIHGSPEEIPLGKSDKNQELAERLDAFREKVRNAKHCKFWTSAEGLAGAVALSFSWFLKEYPGEGWVRASEALTPEIRQEISELRLRVSELTSELRTAEVSEATADDFVLAGGDERIAVPLIAKYRTAEDEQAGRRATGEIDQRVSLCWDDVLGAMGPAMLVEATEEELLQRIQVEAIVTARDEGELPEDFEWYSSITAPSNTVLHQCLLQLSGLGMIEPSGRRHAVSDRSKYWTLTDSGRRVVTKLKAFSSKPKSERSGRAKTARPTKQASDKKKPSTKKAAAKTKRPAKKQAAPRAAN